MTLVPMNGYKPCRVCRTSITGRRYARFDGLCPECAKTPDQRRKAQERRDREVAEWRAAHAEELEKLRAWEDAHP